MRRKAEQGDVLGNKDLELLQQIPGNQDKCGCPAPHTCSGHRIPGSSFFLAVVWLCHPTAFWLLWFLMRSQLMMTLRIPFMWQATSLTTFKILSLSLSLNQSIKNCLRWISWSSSHPRKPSPLTSGWSWHLHRQKQRLRPKLSSGWVLKLHPRDTQLSW